MEVLKDYVWETDESELNDLIDSGYEVIYFDVSLSVIYAELSNCFDNQEVHRNILDIFGYYGPGALLKVDGVYYWLMQV